MNLYYLTVTLTGFKAKGRIWDNLEVIFYRQTGEERDAPRLVTDWNNLDERGRMYAQDFIDELLTLEEVEALTREIQAAGGPEGAKVVRIEPHAQQFPQTVGKVMPMGAIGVGGRYGELEFTDEATGNRYAGSYYLKAHTSPAIWN